MNILAINTAFSESYVAVKTDSKLITKQMDSSLKQSENILGLIDNALSDANININDINSIACVIGPGSFTGIRIGASLCKGFCNAIPHIKRIAINSLDLVSYAFLKTNPNNDYWVILNALSGNLFVAKYSKNGQVLIAPMLASGENIDKINGVVVGIDEEYLDICNQYVKLSSENLLEYSIKLNDEQKESSEFTPVYLRKSQAEAELDKKDGNN